MNKTKDRIALLIGISKYQYATKLKNPINDVKEMSKNLKLLGFETIEKLDCDRKKFMLAINEFGKKIKDYQTGVFYFAGHGIQVDGINYLIPKDANPISKDQVEFDSINANRILSLMENSDLKTNIIILDACRNNPFNRSWSRSLNNEGLAPMNASLGTVIAYATSPGATASDGIGKNGLYTEMLLSEILNPSYTLIQMFQSVRKEVITRSKGNQIPWETTSLIDDFYFNDNRYISIDTFSDIILYHDNKDRVLNHINLKIRDLDKVDEGIFAKEKPIVRVYKKKNIPLFNIFDSLDIILYEDGEREYVIYTRTSKHKEVYKTANKLYNKLGIGIHDYDKAVSFENGIDVYNVSKAKENMAFVMWFFDAATISLKYLSSQRGLFILTINIKSFKPVIKKTLLSKINIDIKKMLSTSIELDKHYEAGKVKSVQYITILEEPILNIFDKAKIRVFSLDKDNVEPDTEINLILYCENNDDSIVNKIAYVLAVLSSIYGKDNNGYGYLEGWEVHNIKDGFYTGRFWSLNEQHQINDLNSNTETIMYDIRIHYDVEEDGLELSILSFNSLMKHDSKLNAKKVG